MSIDWFYRNFPIGAASDIFHLQSFKECLNMELPTSSQFEIVAIEKNI